MKISDEGLDFICDHEGFRANAYPDPATGGEPWTIGYGRAHGVKLGDTCTREQAREWLRADVGTAERCLNATVQGHITQGQADACLSLIFNIGCGNWRKSTVLRELNAGNDLSSANGFLLWNRANGKIMAGLTNRRMDEMEVFLA